MAMFLSLRPSWLLSLSLSQLDRPHIILGSGHGLGWISSLCLHSTRQAAKPQGPLLHLTPQSRGGWGSLQVLSADFPTIPIPFDFWPSDPLSDLYIKFHPLKI